MSRKKKYFQEISGEYVLKSTTMSKVALMKKSHHSIVKSLFMKKKQAQI